jgi:hypothetical protein
MRFGLVLLSGSDFEGTASPPAAPSPDSPASAPHGDGGIDSGRAESGQAIARHEWLEVFVQRP